jgi:hypothetical protein
MSTTTNGHSELAARVASLKSELASLPEGSRSALIEQALIDVPIFPPFCGLILSPTQFEQDLKTIAGRVTVTATLSSTGALNVGDTFQVTASLRNCTGFRLENAKLVATGTLFASVTGATTVDLGDVNNGATKSATFQCSAVAQTPTLAGPADPVINVFGRIVLDLTTATKSTSVLTEIFPT